MGVVEHTFTVSTSTRVSKPMVWKIFDVGGARNQRQAWAPYFTDANAIIFLAPISAFDQVLAEDEGRTQAEGNIRVGDYILIIDSDTIVPEDCFRDAARELAESPEIAIIQHESDVMQVAHHYFENGIAHFTRRINKCISLGCANGEVAPFVGHNAFLRWSALQDAAFVDEAD